MPLHGMKEAEVRELCRRALDGLEFWLRRLIDVELTEVYGRDYLDFCSDNGNRLIAKSIRVNLDVRYRSDAVRYPRVIDASFLDDQINIVCNPQLFSKHFKQAFANLGFTNVENVRVFLEKLILPRNKLSHANPVSNVEALRVICYASEIVESIKDFYRGKNLDREFNVPLIVRVRDSLGNETFLGDSNRHSQAGAMVDHSQESRSYLRCGDQLIVDVEVDSSFSSDDYRLEWGVSNLNFHFEKQFGSRFLVKLDERFVSMRFCAVCWVISNKSWHRLGYFDDQVDIAYRVLPPI